MSLISNRQAQDIANALISEFGEPGLVPMTAMTDAACEHLCSSHPHLFGNYESQDEVEGVIQSCVEST